MTATELRSLLRVAPNAARRASAIATLDGSADLQLAFEVLLETGQLHRDEAVSLLHELQALAAPSATLAIITPDLERLRSDVSALMTSHGSDVPLLKEAENIDRQLQMAHDQIELDTLACARLSERIQQMNVLIKDAENVLGRPVSAAI
ncbi:MAG: hypothetical protein WC815_04085 [Vicinamibacterales bacterium]|jgi:hypothetical protein